MLKIRTGFMLREIANQTIAVPLGQRTSEIHGVISLSESGVLLWNELSSGTDKETLVNILLDTYEIDRETATSDVDDFIKGLYEQGVMEE